MFGRTGIKGPPVRVMLRPERVIIEIKIPKMGGINNATRGYN